MKTENCNINSKSAVSGFFKNVCMDCVFWYECRKGEVDCAEKANMPARASLRA